MPLTARRRSVVQIRGGQLMDSRDSRIGGRRASHACRLSRETVTRRRVAQTHPRKAQHRGQRDRLPATAPKSGSAR
ncbi:hypothetical protein EXIGLDRAFT_481871 [Exidia glandulosa HHB12029]|uniref:Uncharacterized protein n=1 Tax=Exidia glandulosa HHB12029 TaxID=1314781 RepID=A0A165PHE1_EXIGL|nr:hypothetical protein EXIGLDRAFT_481871 [Exidia glandulosa HHB12029]